MIRIDLHTHSTASDGIESPTELVQEASRRGISVLGLTDHDTVDGLAEATAAAAEAGLTLIPGIELSSDSDDAHEIHLLGYFIDPASESLAQRLQWLTRQRRLRIEQIVARLEDLGLPIDMEMVERYAPGGVMGRPHVARALIEIGAAETVRQAFDRYIGWGKPGYVPRARVEAEDAIATIRSAGGVPVLAHPFSTGNVTGVLERLIPAGLRGMEVWYGEYDDNQRAQLLHHADRYGMIPTGGSDWHGAGFREGRTLGSVPVPPSTVELLMDAAAEAAGGQ